MQTEGTIETGVASSHVGWQEADHHLRRIAKQRAGLDAEEARWLRVAEWTGLHRQYGYATILEYMERVLGYGPRAAQERLRVAAELEYLPEMEAALANGRISYSAARELTRVATPKTEQAWLASSDGASLREIESLVRGRRSGDLPGDEPDPDLVEHRLHFDVPAATFALFREARKQLELEIGQALDEADVLAEMCRAVLGGPRDPGRAGHQIALTVCEACGRTWQDGAGQPIEVPATVLERAQCDAQVIGRVDGSQPERASQDIPPAVRRQVHRRDHGRCVVPGCRSARFLDVHHVQFRSRGGTHDPDGLVLLCGSHHDALHDGRLAIEGLAGAWQFLRADGQPYTAVAQLAPGDARSHVGADTQSHVGRTTPGAPPETPVAAPPEELRHEMHGAMRGLGFSAAVAHAAFARAWVVAGPKASIEVYLREALKATRIGRG